MANEEALGPRKTMFVLVIVVGCFAVLWPRILSPLIVGNQQDQLKPNKHDRDAGCCEVIFETEVAILELLNEVCSTIVHSDGKISPMAAYECRKAVNETCGVDIQAFIKRNDGRADVARTTKALLDTMKASNSSCLKEHFGVPIWSLSVHPAINSWIFNDTLKQERPLRAGVPHPAMLERGRAIPHGAPPSRPAPLPPHIRVWNQSPLAGYFDIDIKPPPIPGMRPPLGAGGGPMPAPKSSMGFVMPIYTICIIVFFVYTLSKLLFKRTSSPYEEITPDPQFRRRVFRDDSRQSPDKLGDDEIEALRARLEATERAMQRIVAQLQAREKMEAQDNHARPYTNGTVIHSGPVQIVASQYRTPEPKATEPSFHVTDPKVLEKEPSTEIARDTKENLDEKYSNDYKYAKEPSEENNFHSWEKESDYGNDMKEKGSDSDFNKDSKYDEAFPWQKSERSQEKEIPWRQSKTPEPKEYSPDREESPEAEDLVEEEEELDPTEALIKLTKKVEEKTDNIAKLTGDFLREEAEKLKLSSEKAENFFRETEKPEGEDAEKADKLKLSSQKSIEEQFADLLEEAMKENSPDKDAEDEEEDLENGSVKVIGMELRAHAADGGTWPCSEPPVAVTPMPHAVAHEAADVKSIYLETEIPSQSRVIVTDFAENRATDPPVAKHSSLVVSGKMTLSLIQDAPRDTPERDTESTLDDFTTASALTQPVAQKEDDLSDEDMEEVEEIEVEEIEEEVEEEEVEDEPEYKEDHEQEPETKDEQEPETEEEQ